MAGIMPWDSVLELVNSAVDRIWPDKTKALEIKAQIDAQAKAGALQEMQDQYDNAKAQIAVNQAEAGSQHWFVAAWRPACGWVGAVGLAYSSFLEPLARFTAQVCFHYSGAFPVVDTTITMQVLLGMLGLGAMRSYDKGKGTGNGH